MNAPEVFGEINLKNLFLDFLWYRISGKRSVFTEYGGQKHIRIRVGGQFSWSEVLPLNAESRHFVNGEPKF